ELVRRIKHLGKQKKWQEAVGELRSAEAENKDRKLGVSMYNTALRALAESGRGEEAQALLSEMKKRRIRCDSQTYTAAITACGRVMPLPDWQGAVALLREMRSLGNLDDQTTFAVNAALTACARAGRVKEATDLVNEWRQEGRRLDAMSHGALMHAHATAGDATGALDLLRRMSAEGLRPDIVTLNTV
ncbi:unnamed protein product, partial [Phaeothamnion confervicola]